MDFGGDALAYQLWSTDALPEILHIFAHGVQRLHSRDDVHLCSHSPVANALQQPQVIVHALELLLIAAQDGPQLGKELFLFRRESGIFAREELVQCDQRLLEVVEVYGGGFRFDAYARNLSFENRHRFGKRGRDQLLGGHTFADRVEYDAGQRLHL